MTAKERVQGLGLYLTREPVILALLSALAVLSFLAVGGLSRMYHAQQETLANRWFTRGTADLKDGHFDRAVGDFRAALRYSRDSYDYQLNLAQALIGLKRTDEAYAYLINLWEREPENGLVNLELARIAAQKGQTERALRYYHNAIYATWPGDSEVERRNTRLELIEYLLRINARTQAQSEMIALAANLGDDPSLHQRVGDLFLQAQDYEHALAEYRLTLKSDHRNPAALAGAGLAAFDLGRYSLAQRYLQVAVAANPEDTRSADLLKTTELVLQMDPFRRQISADQRNRIVIEAFATAGDRLKSCAATVKSSGSTSSESLEQSLADSWAKMQPKINERDLRRDPDFAEGAMDLVFEIERQTKAACGPPTGTDLALLLISKLHEGN
ncbi:MAG TPA: tetratricopeptide repeat protein [Terriglobales bacterium]|nr:tetratricopeptide repeat protein [Terriglobales bacterium]